MTLNILQVAERLRVSRRTVYNYITWGILKASGRPMRVDLASVRALLMETE